MCSLWLDQNESCTESDLIMMRQVEKNEVVMCLNSPTLPFLPCFITFCSTHSYTSWNFCHLFMHFFHHYSVFFYVDYGILYEELLVRAKHKSCCICMIYKEWGSLRSPTPWLWPHNYCDVCVCGTYVHVVVVRVPTLVIWRHWRSGTYFRHFLNQPAQKLINCRTFSYLQRRQRRGHGENLLPPLRFYVQERHPGRATSPASNVTGRPSWRSHPPPALRAESVV